ncbi:hypothetical protein OCH239_18935 [Roseivivax halodurans JCM 10272]|uniref:Uncharacterized protein n=1 Tax=Roseivivax halodurans JCM 10272 TaxID=1449350 RepID=X7E9U9_9RHOB|nr:hypothetical protein OCH239_18935 [Roseivivax halodurans JCM 10272]
MNEFQRARLRSAWILGPAFLLGLICTGAKVNQAGPGVLFAVSVVIIMALTVVGVRKNSYLYVADQDYALARTALPMLVLAFNLGSGILLAVDNGAKATLYLLAVAALLAGVHVLTVLTHRFTASQAR